MSKVTKVRLCGKERWELELVVSVEDLVFILVMRGLLLSTQGGSTAESVVYNGDARAVAAVGGGVGVGGAAVGRGVAAG